jgi:5-methylcytosine-specific restriction enzyme B
MMAHPHRNLPLSPLLRAYVAVAPPCVEQLAELQNFGAKVRAILTAPRIWLHDAFLDAAEPEQFAKAVGEFYGAVVQPPLHADTLHRRIELVRHGIAHLVRSRDPLPVRLGRCVAPAGTYYVAGLGPAFWTMVVQAIDPERCPAWTVCTLAGLTRLGLARWHSGDGATAIYSALLATYRRILRQEPSLTALHVDHFLLLVGRMHGRDLWSGAGQIDPIFAVIRQERRRCPLRQRLKERGGQLAEARSQFEAGLRANDVSAVIANLRIAAEESARREPIRPETLPVVARLWNADDPLAALEAFEHESLEPVRRWFGPAVLHLRDGLRFPPFDEATRAGMGRLDDASDLSYALHTEAVAALCRQYQLHPLEVPSILAALASDHSTLTTRHSSSGFAGFCGDTFRFLKELSVNNRRGWMERHRDRYHFAVREPLADLCRALTERYVEPVLRQTHGWDLETQPRSGRALSRVVKNDYGRSVPYHDSLWITFYRPDRGGKRDDVQLFVRLAADGVSYGLRLGRRARVAGRQFRHAVREHSQLLFQALAAGEAFAHCRFGRSEDLSDAVVPSGPAELCEWADGKVLVVGKYLPANDPLLMSEDVVGEILLTFDRLLPAYACAIADDPLPLLNRRAGRPYERETDHVGSFCRATSLSEAWPRRALDLLGLKRQLILQGVPGTGKTYVARHLARLLTRGRDEAIRLIQFHPAYSYEEFVEGIKPRTIEIDGRHEVTYPVEDGLLCAFAAGAAREPTEPFVLLIDEINRGNLPRIFGELLYLLEYRDQALTLPYSKRPFRLPANLYLVGTMNAADRSVAHIDQALRRRFSFLEMPPDAAVLARWLETHPPRGGDAFAGTVVKLFEELNARLAADLGPERQIGHSYFMLPQLDDDKLAAVWDHHISPVLSEYFASQPGRAAAYNLSDLLHGRKPKRPMAAKSR